MTPAPRRLPANRYIVFLLIAVLGCALDLATKSWIFARLNPPGREQRPPIVLWEGVFSLTTSLNEGALFGVGQGFVLVFAALSIAAAIGIFVWLFWFGAAEDRWLNVSLGLITAGIFGNLYDRLGLPGLEWQTLGRDGEPVYAVRDWLHFKIEGVIDWPVFNLADSFLVVGAAMILWHAFWIESAAGAHARDANLKSDPETPAS